MVTDEMMRRAIEAYAKDTGAEGFQLEGWIEPAIRAALEAALSAAEPVAWQPRYKQEVIDHLRTVSDNVSEYAMTVFPTKDQAEEYGHGGHQVRPLYVAPALAVVSKELPYHCDVCSVPGYGDAPCSPLCDRSALSAQVQDVAGWHDISTAPQDGTTFLAIMAKAYSPRATLCKVEDGKFFSPSQGEKFVVPGWNQWWPTHWMPLPAAPAKQEGGHD
ncbi:hypothetical protein PCC82_11665 [Agrobacterium deltaense]